MSFRFHYECPRCRKSNSDVVHERRNPVPRVSCGDCLMEDIEVVAMTLTKVEEITEADDGV